MSEIGIGDAARNNAAWCDAVCSAHGSPGTFSASLWWSRAPAPPYYPNLVTLDPASGPAMEALGELERAPPAASWAVKDSFAVLPLEQAGFRLQFEAEWILRPASIARHRRRSRSERWFRVESEPALAAWEAAWGESLGQPRVFLPALLRRSEIAILGALGSGGAITAGVVANRTGDLVGISNLFANRQAGGALRADCIEAVLDRFPGIPLVGYESAQDLVESRALGFRSVGSLRVWVKGV
jgi:hypothetical protein